MRRCARNTGFHPTANDQATDNTVVSQEPDFVEPSGKAAPLRMSDSVSRHLKISAGAFEFGYKFSRDVLWSGDSGHSYYKLLRSASEAWSVYEHH
jgi:hypothetical protein